MKLRRRAIAAIGVALLLAGSAAIAAAPPVAHYPTGKLEIGGKPVPVAKILDARALPDMAGKPSLMVTLDPAVAEALAGSAAAEAPVQVMLDGKPLGASPAGALKADHIVQISGDLGNYDQVAALARRISGQDPLPDSEGD